MKLSRVVAVRNLVVGSLAEQSRAGQRTMFQPRQSTVQVVFEKLKDIAALTGHSSGTKKVEKIQALLVACRGSEARYELKDALKN